MALTGTYTRTLDDKRRFAVPKRLREDFDDSDLTCLYIAPGTDQSLAMYTPANFDRLARRLTRKSSKHPINPHYFRLFYSRAEKADLDAQGRIRISDRLIEFAGLTRELVLVGVNDHVEIWDRKAWDAFLRQFGPEFDEMAAQAVE